MNKKFKTNTVKCFHYDGAEVHKQYPDVYLMSYSFNTKLHAIGRVSPFLSHCALSSCHSCFL